MEQLARRTQPTLLIGDRSEAILRGIARGAMKHAPEVVERLLAEVDRADVVAESEVPDDVVRLGSFITYKVRLTGAINTIRLVPPHEANPHQMRVSVVSEIGAALIGLKPHQQIEWDFGGHRHLLEVLRVGKEL